MTRTPLIAGNWKMHKTVAEAKAYLEAFLPRVAAVSGTDIALCVPYTVLASMVGGTSELYAESGAQVKAAVGLLVDRAVASGAIRLDIEPLDLLRALAGVAGISSVPGWEKSAKRLVDILIAGVRAPPEA